jgi:hypothetical protein
LISLKLTTLILFFANSYIIYQFFKKNKTFVIGLYSAQIFFLYLTPLAVCFIVSNSYSGYRLGSVDSAMQYLLLYNIVLITIYSIFSTLLGRLQFKFANFQKFFSSNRANLTASLFIIISVCADIYLYTIGKVKGAHPSITNVTDIAYNLSTVKIAAVIFYSNYLKTNNIKRKGSFSYLMIWIIISLTLFFNFQKYNFFILFTLFVYLHSKFISLHKKKFIGCFIFFFLIYILIAPIFNLYKYGNITLAESIHLGLKEDFVIPDNYPNYKEGIKINWFIKIAFLIREGFFNLFADRLNYIGPLSRIFELGSFERAINYSAYLDNIIGLAPRFAWPDKPFIGINGNIIGHDLNILQTNDNVTSISLGSIGESYYLLGWFGIAIAAFQGLLMAMLDKFSLYKNYIVSVIYFFISVEIVIISSYSILIPKIVKIILIYIILILVFEKFFVRKRYLT